ncbi:MAG: response regulator [Pseudobacteriovorax sp.]|nr:response regulator [Pseudobacteriovorax sp.]
MNPRKTNQDHTLVVMAEDNRFDCREVSRSFEEASHPSQLVCFENGQQLMDGLATLENVACILLDMNMPVMDGFAVMEQLDNHPKLGDIPIFVMTSSSDHQEILEDKGCQPTAFIRKPVSFDDVRSLLSGR